MTMLIGDDRCSTDMSEYAKRRPREPMYLFDISCGCFPKTYSFQVSSLKAPRVWALARGFQGLILSQLAFGPCREVKILRAWARNRANQLN